MILQLYIVRSELPHYLDKSVIRTRHNLWTIGWITATSNNISMPSKGHTLCSILTIPHLLIPWNHKTSLSNAYLKSDSKCFFCPTRSHFNIYFRKYLNSFVSRTGDNIYIIWWKHTCKHLLIMTFESQQFSSTNTVPNLNNIDENRVITKNTQVAQEGLFL